jgi:hypothetical protein
LQDKVFEETFQQASLNPELAGKWVDLNVERLHLLLLDMEAGGGGRRTLDAMTELAEVSLLTQA